MFVSNSEIQKLARDLEDHELKNKNRAHGSARESRKNLEGIVNRLLKLAELERKKPTIADTGWKPEYKGMWAKLNNGSHRQENVIIRDRGIVEGVLILTRTGGTNARNDQVTPLGFKADLDFENPSPRKLETVEQLNAAPVGTLVIDRDGDRWTKQRDGQWSACPPEHVIEYTPLLVNRWGNGES